MTAAAAVALAMTAPGQSAAVSIFVDPIIRDLGVSRSDVSAAYLVGTLAGALVMPFLGRIIDRYGPRRTMVVIAVCFGAILIAGSFAVDVFGLAAAFVGIRVGGQGALNLVATMTVAIYVHRRRGRAMGMMTAIGTAGISVSPILLELLLAVESWRTVWIIEGLVVWALVVPAALFLVPRHPPPRSTGSPSGNPADVAARSLSGEVSVPVVNWTLRQAVRTGMFWVVTAGVGTCSFIATGLIFHQLSILGERGLSSSKAAAIFLPQAIAGLAASFGLGYMADRFSDRLLIISAMLVQAAATILAGWLLPGVSAVLYGIALGACVHGILTLEAVAFPRCFGLRHLGAIRGVVHAITVGASAFGPFALALGRSASTSYRPVLLVLAVLPLAVAGAAVLVRRPRSPLEPAPARARSPRTT